MFNFAVRSPLRVSVKRPLSDSCSLAAASVALIVMVGISLSAIVTVPVEGEPRAYAAFATMVTMTVSVASEVTSSSGTIGTRTETAFAGITTAAGRVI